MRAPSGRHYRQGSRLLAWADCRGRRFIVNLQRLTQRLGEGAVVRELREVPGTTCGVAIIVAVLTNVGLLVLLGRAISPWGLGVRGVLLLVGITAVRSGDWRAIGQGSRVMTWLNPRLRWRHRLRDELRSRTRGRK